LVLCSTDLYLNSRGWGGEDDVLSNRVQKAYGKFNRLSLDVGYYLAYDAGHQRDKSNQKVNSKKRKQVKIFDCHYI
jgi:hypothetical protein